MPPRKRRHPGEGGTVHQLNDGYWVAALNNGYVNGQRQRKRFRGTTPEEAIARRKEYLEAHTNGPQTPSRRQTLESYAAQWSRTTLQTRIATGNLKEQSAQSTLNNLRWYVLPFIGKYRLDQITPAVIDELTLRLGTPEDRGGSGYKQNTVRLARAALSSVLRYAVRDGLIPFNPVRESERPNPKKDARKATPLEPEEAVYLLDAVRDDPFGPFIATALYTGLREGEIAALRWEDIDWNAKTITVTGAIRRFPHQGVVRQNSAKTPGSEAAVPMVDPLADWLKQQRLRQEALQNRAGENWSRRVPGLVFTSSKGTPWDLRWIHRRWVSTCERLNLGPLPFHDLRHTTGTLAVYMGVPLEVVTELLRHSSIQITKDFYVEIYKKVQHEGAEKFAAGLAAAALEPFEDAFSPAEVRKLADEFPEEAESLRLAVLLAAHCTLGPSELLALRRRDLDVQRHMLTVANTLDDHLAVVVPLTAPRSIQLPKAIWPDIEEHLAEFVVPDEDGWIFPGTKGSSTTTSRLLKAWKHAVEKVGFGDRPFQDLRRSGLQWSGQG